MWVHRLAVTLAVATYVLLLVGGLVHGTDSGLACPDWPLCYGQVMPEMVGHVAYEHTHRLVATGVGLLTIALAVAVHRTRKRGRAEELEADPLERTPEDDVHLRRLTIAAVLLVVVQGVLGGLTVLYRLPDAVSTTHLGVSMLFFALTLYLALRSRPGAAAARPAAPRPVRVGVRLAAALVYCQIVLGALVRHVDGAALACQTDLLLCRGHVWPDWHYSAQLHVLHRANGVFVVLVLIALALVAARALGRSPLRTLLLAAPAIAFVQVGLGVASILRFLEVYTVTAHLGVAALLLADLVCAWILSRRGGVAARSVAPPSQIGVAPEAHAV